MHWQDLKNNPQARQRLISRAKILQAIRDFFSQEGFLEIDSPLLVSRPALEVHLNHFETVVVDEKGRHFPAYLITSPEYSLKKILAAGFPKIFQLGRVFRQGEPWNEQHNPEFTMLEWYRSGTDYWGIMEDAERLVEYLVKNLQLEKSEIQNPKSETNPNFQNSKLNYQGQEIDLSIPWERLSMREAWKKYAGVDLDDFLTQEKMAELVRQKGYQSGLDDTFDDLFFKIFLSEIEPKTAALNRPVFLYDYPAQMAALSKKKKEDPRYAERFELYIAGLELANAYSELIDWQEQEARFQSDQEKRRQLGKKVYNIDDDLIAALRSGLPECGGIALGVDRLVMLLLNARDIREVILFAADEMFDND